MTIAGHARAALSVRRAKGRGGLAGFALAGLASHLHGASLADTGGHALAGGVAAYVVAWLAAVAVWRSLLGAEQRRTIRRSERPVARTRVQADATALADTRRHRAEGQSTN